MATRDKYNFTQQTDLWGIIKYSDVPSYSSTSVGSTGNAYLVRNFLKKFFPFLDCTVNKTSGGSVNVKIQKFTVKFTFTEAGVTKQFILDARSLEGILEPLFEGQGFDGMTDSTYSIPLPKMYNDDGQDVSYGYGYLFVDNNNTYFQYEVNLDKTIKNNKGIKYEFDSSNSPSSDPSKSEEIPQKTIEYIKLAAVVNTNAASPTTNQSDLVTLEKGDSKITISTLEQEIIDFLAEKNIGADLDTIRYEFNINKNYIRTDVNRAMSDLLIKDLIDSKQVINVGLLYYVDTKGKSYITPKQPSLDNQNDPQQIVFDSTNKSTLTSGDIAAIEFITQNYTILKDMEKESPELYNGISEGLRLIMSLTKDGTGQLEPFKPLENQQQLVDQLKEDDFDLSEVDLEEIDLTGLEDDLELNDDELGDFDLTEFNELSDFVESELMPTAPPVDIENLDALQKNILMILDKPPAKGKGTLYNEMDQSEIWAEVDETIANEYSRFDVQFALDVLIGLKLVTASNGVPVEYRLIDDKRTSETTANIKNELSPLTPTVEKILRILYRFTGKLSADNIKDDLSNMNIILPHKAIFTRLIALRDRGLVQEINTSYGGIVWQITSLGNEYVDKLPKEKTAGQVREEEKQAKIEKEFGSLNYDFYLVLKILNDTMGMLTAGTVTTILQQQFNKNPKWDEFDILTKLRGLLSAGLALGDTQNSTEYFEISAYGEDVFKYLSEQESKGLYPKSKPTEQTVAARPSPTESATLNSVGTIKKGNDGNNWEVKESSKGVKRWVKIK